MLTKAIVRPPCIRFAEGLTTIDLGAPNYTLALEQHANYCNALERCGLKVVRLEADERYPDSTFVEDTAVLVPTRDRARDQGFAIRTRPGAPSRTGEVESIAEVLARSYPQLHLIEAPGTLDGGDVCEAGDHFFIGISERTNEAGARQLATLLASFGYTSSFIDISPLPNILHLKSGLAFLGNKQLVTIEELADHDAFRGYELIRVRTSEQYAANCVRINDYVLVAASYPEFERALQKLDYKTLAIEITEFQKMDGGLSCLSLRF